MSNIIKESHYLDENENPIAGRTEGNGFEINWQSGALGRGEARQEPNGAFVEDIIQAAVGRLKFYQESKFKCAENDNALKHLENALIWLQRRTHDRENRKVEGTHKV